MSMCMTHIATKCMSLVWAAAWDPVDVQGLWEADSDPHCLLHSGKVAQLLSRFSTQRSRPCPLPGYHSRADSCDKRESPRGHESKQGSGRFLPLPIWGSGWASWEQGHRRRKLHDHCCVIREAPERPHQPIWYQQSQLNFTRKAEIISWNYGQDLSPQSIQPPSSVKVPSFQGLILPKQHHQMENKHSNSWSLCGPSFQWLTQSSSIILSIYVSAQTYFE